MGGEGRPPAASANSETPQGSSIFYFSCRLPENPHTLYLKDWKITTTENTDLCIYDENDAADQDKWKVDSYGEVCTFLNHTIDKKEFDDDRDNPVSMGGEVHY